MFNNLTERESRKGTNPICSPCPSGQREQNRSWFRFRRWMIPILLIGFWGVFTYLAKIGLINEKLFDLFIDKVAPILLWPSMIWLVIELFIWILSTSIREGNKEYFVCQKCGKEYFKTHQVEKNICKSCYGR